jgi:hypothetical protein
MPPFNFEQLREDVLRRADAWKAEEIHFLRLKRRRRAKDCRLRAAVLEQLAHDLEQQERAAMEAR